MDKDLWLVFAKNRDGVLLEVFVLDDYKESQKVERALSEIYSRENVFSTVRKINQITDEVRKKIADER